MRCKVQKEATSLATMLHPSSMNSSILSKRGKLVK
jgi:hypothetical protein